MITDYHIIEHQKARLRARIDLHKKNVILQSVVSFLCVAGGIYAGQKRSLLVPLVIAPCAATSFSKLAQHESKRRRHKEILDELEQER